MLAAGWTSSTLQTQQVCDARPEELTSWRKPSAPEAAERRLAFACCLLAGDGIPDESPLKFLDALDDVVRAFPLLIIDALAPQRQKVFFTAFGHSTLPVDIAIAAMDREQAPAIGRHVVGEIRLLPRLVGLLSHQKDELRKVTSWFGPRPCVCVALF